MNDNDLIIVFVSCPAEESERLGTALIEGRLAACVKILPAKSLYVWDGKLCREEETLLIIKSRRSLYPALEKKVRAIHSYDTPEIIALGSEAVSSAASTAGGAPLPWEILPFSGCVPLLPKGRYEWLAAGMSPTPGPM